MLPPSLADDEDFQEPTPSSLPENRNGSAEPLILTDRRLVADKPEAGSIPRVGNFTREDRILKPVGRLCDNEVAAFRGRGSSLRGARRRIGREERRRGRGQRGRGRA